MLQLVLDGLEMPESLKGGYQVDRTRLSVDVVMISGRIAREVRGSVWEIKYQYGYFNDEQRQNVLAVCEKGLKEPIAVGFLPPNGTGEELYYSSFLVTDFKRPTFYWSSDGSPVWAGFEVTLREVEPSSDTATIRIDSEGHVIWEDSGDLGFSLYLDDNGHLIMEAV